MNVTSQPLRVPCQRFHRRGFTLVELLVVIAIIGVLIALLIPAVQASRSSASRLTCANNLRQLGVALQHYESANKHLPSGAAMQAYAPEPRLAPTFVRWSALALVTPYLERGAVYDALDLTLPFYVGDNPLSIKIRPANAEIVKLVLPEFLCPSDIGERVHPDLGPTNYVLCAGSGAGGGTPLNTDGAFFVNSQARLSQIPDGTSKTVLISESLLGQPHKGSHDPQTEYRFTLSLTLTDTDCDAALQWNYVDPRGFAWASGEYRAALYNHRLAPNSATPDCIGAIIGGPARYSALGWRAARSRHAGGVNVGLADGSTHFVDDNIDLAVWRALSTIAGGDQSELP